MFYFSPLEQFELIFVLSAGQGVLSQLDFFLNVAFLLFPLIGWFLKSGRAVPTNFQYALELVYKFVLSIVLQQAGHKGLRYFPIFLFIFMGVVLLNFLGMLPFSFTVTGHIVMTFFMGLSVNLGSVLIGFYLHGLKFLNIFVPHGVPSSLLPMVVTIEVFSYLIRIFSISIRLFVNMMSGHCLLFVISSFIFGILVTSYWSIVIFAGIYLALFILELAIAGLQGYVFIILGCIYLSDSLQGGH